MTLMSDHSNESIEALLRASFDGPVPDAGFSERVMQALPARRVRRRWLIPASMTAGIVTCWIALSSTSLVRVASHDLVSGKLSASILIMLATILGIALLACWWAVVEADDPA
jgi:hypothetical protein